MTYPFVKSAVDLGRARGPRLAFVIHMAEGGGTVGYLSRQNPNGVSVHFVIERSGRTVQMLGLERMHSSIRASAIRTTNDPDGFYGAAARTAIMGQWGDIRQTLGPNHASIAVEIEGFARDGPNTAQQAALKALYADLRRTFPGIRSLGHRDFASYKACPGKRIPWSQVGGHGRQPAPIQEAPVADPLITATAKIVNTYLPRLLAAGDEEGVRLYTLRAIEYLSRIAASAGADVDDDVLVTEISSNPSIAIHQILLATGHPVEFTEAGASIAIDPQAVLKDATPEQVRELALLGFFGQPGLHADVDYGLFEQYYVGDDLGNWAPKDPDKSAWSTYLASKA
jgi:hypothetical protein